MQCRSVDSNGVKEFIEHKHEVMTMFSCPESEEPMTECSERHLRGDGKVDRDALSKL